MVEIGSHIRMQICDSLLQNKEKSSKGIKLFIFYLQLKYRDRIYESVSALAMCSACI